MRDELRAHVSATGQMPEAGELLTELTRGLEIVRSGEDFEIRDFGSLPSVILELPVRMESGESHL